MNLIAVAAFADNYIWMLHDGKAAVVVDPGDASPVLAALSEHSLRLVGILVTHHHSDHVGGLAALRPHLHGPIFGPAKEIIPRPYSSCIPGDIVEVLGLKFSVIDVPGHTAGHIAYFSEPEGEAPLLFCGDTLFSGGCGRLFEGTPAQMHESLQSLAALPGNTRVCCAHEYTLANLRFARTIEPDNVALRDYQAWCQKQRDKSLPTLPSTMSVELQINPFLRCTEPAVVAAVQAHEPTSLAADEGQPDASPVSVFATLRQWKNDFK